MSEQPRNPVVQCRFCQRKIVFAKTKRDKWIPLDPKSITAIDLEILKQGATLKFRHGEHICHFNTCPDRPEHMKTKTWKKG